MTIKSPIKDVISGNIQDVVGYPTSGSALSPYFQDNFDGTASTSLPSHTPDVDTVGGGWLKWSSYNNLVLNGSGDAHSDSAATAQRNLAEMSLTDFIIKVSGVSTSSGFVHIGCMDTSDLTGGWTEGVRVGYAPQVSVTRLQTYSGGAATLRDSSPTGAQTDIGYYFRKVGATAEMYDESKTLLHTFNSLDAAQQACTGAMLGGRFNSDRCGTYEVFNTTDLSEVP